MNRRDFWKLGLVAPALAVRAADENSTMADWKGRPMPPDAKARMEARLRLMDVALGRQPADLVITHGTLLSTYTAEQIPQQGIAISGKRIAAVGDVERHIGPNTKVVDAKGRHLVPGFVDSHYHCESSRLSPTQHANLTLPMGLTAYFEGTHEIANAASGLPGVEYFLTEGNPLPQKIYPCTSSATPASPMETSSGYIGYWETLESFQRGGNRIRGIDEVMDLPRVTEKSERLHGVIQAALDTGHMVAGHGSPPIEVLDGWIVAGMSNTHSGRTKEALAMIRKGLEIQLKTERTEEIIQQLLALPLKDWRNIGLAVDDRSALELLRFGSMNHEVRRSIELGVPSITAYQMGTINNAVHWKVDRDHGVIAPGRYADVLVISDFDKVVIDQVYADGRLVAEEGRMVSPLAPPATIPEACRHRVRLKRPLRASDFRISASPGRRQVETYVMRPRNTDPDRGSMLRTLRVRDGEVQRDLSRGITKMAIVERYHLTGNIGLCFWELGFDAGAVAWTINHDHHNLGVIGATDEDMAVAANRCAAIDGGYVAVKDGKVLAELSLPIAGLMTHEEPASVAAKLEKIDGILTSFHPAPMLAEHPSDKITFMNLTCDPYKYALTDLGLFELTTGRKLAAGSYRSMPG